MSPNDKSVGHDDAGELWCKWCFDWNVVLIRLCAASSPASAEHILIFSLPEETE